MLLSLSHKFLFVANLKTASTSIEAALTDFAEIRIKQTQYGKHDTLSEISEKLPWVRRYVPYNEFFVFGVIREPVDYLLSLYNAHSRENLRGSAMPTRGMDFDTFLNVWCKDNPQAEPQHRRFTDRHGRFQVSHLIDYDNLSKEFGAICARLELGELRLKHLNLSPENLTRYSLTDAQIARIERDYAQDCALIRNRPRAV
jgi:Sulfotransferase family